MIHLKEMTSSPQGVLDLHCKINYDSSDPIKNNIIILPPKLQRLKFISKKKTDHLPLNELPDRLLVLDMKEVFNMEFSGGSDLISYLKC